VLHTERKKTRPVEKGGGGKEGKLSWARDVWGRHRSEIIIKYTNMHHFKKRKIQEKKFPDGPGENIFPGLSTGLKKTFTV